MYKLTYGALVLLLAACTPGYNSDQQHALRSYRTNWSLYGDGIPEEPLSDSQVLRLAKRVCPLIRSEKGNAEAAFASFLPRTGISSEHTRIVFGTGVGAYCREYLGAVQDL